MKIEQERAELLPCLFCGSRNVAQRFTREASFEALSFVECYDCGARGSGVSGHGGEAIEEWNRRAALQSQPSHAGWKEAAIAWEVCASLHREFCKGRDPFFKTRQADFVKHAEDARANALETEVLQSQDRADAERYRWLRDEAGLMVLPYDDHGMGPEFPCGSDLDKAIDHARRVEGEL